MVYKIKLKTMILKVSEPVISNGLVTPELVFDFSKEIYKELDDDQEHFTILFLNQMNQVTGYKTLFSGGQTIAIVDIKVIFRNALLFGAVAIIAVHNHPSGNLTPSADDIIIFKKIEEAGELLDIRITDSLIISKDNFYSFKKRGM